MLELSIQRDGTIEAPAVGNSRQGYAALENWMRIIMQEHGKTEAIVGFEPTGHYWFTLGDHLQKKGHRLGIVNP